MRPEHSHNHHEPRIPRPETNGASQNGASPHANGDGRGGETNGWYASGGAVRTPFYGHDREEVTRILLQSLSDLGYHGAAKQLSSESGYELEIPRVAAFRSAVQHGEWEEADALLFGSEPAEMEGGVTLLGNGHAASPGWRKNRTSFGSTNGFGGQGLPLAESADITWLKFLLRRQKYLELLESRDLNTALNVLRNELTPLKGDVTRLHALSSLMMCQSGEDVKQQAEWDGARGDSRSMLLSELSKSISPAVMIPEHRLATLFTAVQDEQVLSCHYHNTAAQPSLYTNHECSIDDFPLHTVQELKHHTEEVWYVEFSHDGSMLATAGQDGLVCIYDTNTWALHLELREHDRNATSVELKGVCYVAFSPDDQYLISCSLNKEFVVVRTRDGHRVAIADHFDYPVITAAWLPDSQTFVVGTQGSRRPLGLYSLRPPPSSSTSGASSNAVLRNNEIHSFRDPPWDAGQHHNALAFRTADCAIDAAGTRMVATTLDNRILLHDLRTRQRVAEWQMEDKLTSINFNLAGTQLLLNMNAGRVLALDSATGDVLMRYVGVQQAEFVLRSRFGGAAENFVVSGSEDARVYVWRRQTGVLVAELEAPGAGTVNAVAWHPRDPAVLVSAGDDRRVRVWTSAARMSPHAATEAGASRTSLASYPHAR